MKISTSPLQQIRASSAIKLVAAAGTLTGAAGSLVACSVVEPSPKPVTSSATPVEPTPTPTTTRPSVISSLQSSYDFRAKGFLYRVTGSASTLTDGTSEVYFEIQNLDSHRQVIPSGVPEATPVFPYAMRVDSVENGQSKKLFDLKNPFKGDKLTTTANAPDSAIILTGELNSGDYVASVELRDKNEPDAKGITISFRFSLSASREVQKNGSLTQEASYKIPVSLFDDFGLSLGIDPL